MERIHFIEERKTEGRTLDEIKKEINEKFSEVIDVLEIRLKNARVKKRECSDCIST
ncbi:hypothetical protein [Robertmurraya siralis]|uniref:hypothetical protein n=1 Tax=Robertmurraya siralis TaxID=77777 RepID=UPI001BB35742